MTFSSWFLWLSKKIAWFNQVNLNFFLLDASSILTRIEMWIDKLVRHALSYDGSLKEVQATLNTKDNTLMIPKYLSVLCK